MEYNRFEKARIVGARALQLSMGAPVLLDIDDIGRNPVEVALQEYEAEVIPITVQRMITAKRHKE